MREVIKILNICRCKDKHRDCNVCGNKIHRKNQQELVNGTIIHEISFGKNNQSITVAICDNCLNEFADKLWKYLEED